MTDQTLPEKLLARYRRVAVSTVYGGVHRMGYDPCFMRGVNAFTPGRHMAATARTLRFVPPRTDIQEETQRGEQSPEYLAMGSCGPGDVIVMDALGKAHASVGGDVKMLQLKSVGAEGVVTDGAIRDLDAVKSYGLTLFAGGRTGAVGAPDIWPFQANVAVQCGGVAVCPGDLVVGDDDGVVVVARRIVEEVIDWAEEQSKGLIEKERVAWDKYCNPATFARLHQEHRSS